MHALITRPIEDAKPLADLLAARGVECSVEPLLEIVPREDAEIDLDGVQALLFTSTNGVRAFAAKSSRRDLKVLTVGEASAAAARDAGFTAVIAASGDVETLAELAIARLDPKAGPLFHGAASALAGDLQGRLEAAGFTLRRAVLYDAKPAATFSPETRMNLALGGIDMVLLFSPRTARTFVELWRAAESPSLAKATALCLSPAVAREIAELGWQHTETATSPDQPAMLALVAAEITRRTPAVEVLPPVNNPDQEIRQEPRHASRVEAEREAYGVPPIPPAPEKRASPWGGIIAGLIAGAVAGVIVLLAAPAWQPLLGFSSSTPVVGGASPDLSALQSRLASLEAQSAKAITPDAVMATVNDATGKVEKEIGPLSARLDKIEHTLAALPQLGSPQAGTAPNGAPPVSTLDVQQLQFRIAKLETDLTQVSQQVSSQAANAAPASPDLSANVADLKAANDALTRQLSVAKDEIAKLDTALAALQAQQSDLSGKVGQIAAAPAPVTAAEQRRTALVVALGGLRGALPLDKPYAANLKSVDDLAGADATLKAQLAPALDPLRSIAASGAPTLAQLQASFPTQEIAKSANAEEASSAVGADQSWSERLINRLSEAVTIRPVGADAEGDGPLARLARGEAKLKAGDLSGAVAEIGALDGRPAAAAGSWLGQAKARLAQDQAGAALDQVSTALLAPPEAQ